MFVVDLRKYFVLTPASNGALARLHEGGPDAAPSIPALHAQILDYGPVPCRFPAFAFAPREWPLLLGYIQSLFYHFAASHDLCCDRDDETVRRLLLYEKWVCV